MAGMGVSSLGPGALTDVCSSTHQHNLLRGPTYVHSTTSAWRTSILRHFPSLICCIGTAAGFFFWVTSPKLYAPAGSRTQLSPDHVARAWGARYSGRAFGQQPFVEALAAFGLP